MRSTSYVFPWRNPLTNHAHMLSLDVRPLPVKRRGTYQTSTYLRGFNMDKNPDMLRKASHVTYSTFSFDCVPSFGVPGIIN